MVYLAAVVSLLLLVGALAVIAAMIVPNFARIADLLRADVLWTGEQPTAFSRSGRADPVNQPRVTATRSLMRVAA